MDIVCSKEEFEKEFYLIYTDIIEDIKICKNKKAFLLGGQPGAGKSGLISFIKDENRVIEINADDYRKRHPYYQELKNKYGDDYVLYTQNFIGKMTESLVEKLSDEGFPLVIEGTLRTVEVPLKTCEMLKKKGYNVDLNVVLVKPEISLLGTFQRYEKMLEVGTVARETPIEHHNNVARNIAGNLDILREKEVFNDIKIYNREGDNLYSQKNNPNQNPGDIFRKEFSRNFSQEEINFINKTSSDILKSMEKRKADQKQIEVVEKQINIIQEKIKLQENSKTQKKRRLKM